MGIFDFFKKKEYGEQLKEQTSVQTVSNHGQNIISNSTDLIFIIEDVFVIRGRGTVVTGEVVSGTVNLNDFVTIKETGQQTQVLGVEMFRKQCTVAQTGEKVGLLLHGVSRNDVSSGYTLVK